MRWAERTGEAVALDIASYGADRYGHRFDLAPLADRLGMPLTRRPFLSSRVATKTLPRLGFGRYVGEGRGTDRRRGL